MLAKRTDSPRRLFVSSLCGLALLAGCGGGGVDLGTLAVGGVDSGGTGSAVVLGPITGFGSIIVNGVRFDDSAATITDDDGAALSRDGLRLGMMATVDGSALTTDATGTQAVASSIRVASELLGPVSDIDPAASSFRVLGQTVRVTTATFFDDRLAAGVGGLQEGAIVEVHGQYDPAGSRYAATRVEPVAEPDLYSLRGAIAALDAAAKTLTIGGQLIDFAELSQAALPDLSVGAVVRARLRPGQEAGAWVATSLASGFVGIPDRDHAKIEGRISSWTSSRQFSVDGIPVDASTASFPDGDAGVVLSARVEVEGSSAGGVLRAAVVEVESDDDREDAIFELHGPIEALDVVARTLIVRGVTVAYDGSVLYESGTVNDLAPGRDVEVRAVLSADGTRLQATEIAFE